MYPLHFEPIYQSYVWGGERIFSLYPRKKGKGNTFAESWEISDREEGMSVVSNGPWRGKTLRSLIQERGYDLLGKKYERFPLLIKIIDAKENLSIQVHPDEKIAKKLGGEPKTESWIALAPSHVLAGIQKGVSPESFQKAIAEKKGEKCLYPFSMQEGEAIFLPGGRVHAILAGSFLYEVQQNSNTTYRLYDWGREGRELHLKKGFAAIDWNEKKPELYHPKGVLEEKLIHSPFFTIERIQVKKEWNAPSTLETFQIFFFVRGKGILRGGGHKEPFQAGMSFLIPAHLEKVSIEGDSVVLRTITEGNRP